MHCHDCSTPVECDEPPDAFILCDPCYAARDADAVLLWAEGFDGIIYDSANE